MKNNYYELILTKLSSIAPLFAKTILDKAISKRGKTPFNVSAIDLLDILKNDINTKLSQHQTTTNALLQAGSGCIITNEKNKIVYISPYVKKIIKVQNLNTEKLFDILVDLGFCSPIHETSQLLVREFQPKGLEQTYDVTILPIFNQAGAITGTMSVIKDVTLKVALECEVIEQSKKLKEEVVAREKIEKELLENQTQLIHTSRLASLGEMAGGIAHEINNPLATINLTLKVLKKLIEKENLNKDAALDSINDINTTVARIHKIVTGLKTISRSDTTQEFARALLQDILDDVMGLCNEKLKNNEVELLIENTGETLEQNVLCNRVQLSQVMINLIHNAYDAIGKNNNKWIKLKFSHDNNLLIIRVTDSGSRIEEHIISKMFQPFFTTKEVGKGTGIGLSISKSIIESHKGRLYIDSQCENTSFVIEIPQV